VLSKSEYLTANAGLSFDYQLINVPDFNGVGESQPSPFFYQVNNLYSGSTNIRRLM
jgi:intron-binding protein aquarius